MRPGRANINYTMKTTPDFSNYKAQLTEEIRTESIKAAQMAP